MMKDGVFNKHMMEDILFLDIQNLLAEVTTIYGWLKPMSLGILNGHIPMVELKIMKIQ